MVERLGWTLVHFVWEGTAIAGVLALILLATRRAASSLRYGLALAALVLLAALPLATFLALAPRTEATVASGALGWTSGVMASAGAPVANPMPFLVDGWALGVVLLSLRLVGTLLHLERWRRHHARPADPEAQAHLDALARRLGLRRRVALFLSDRLEVPSAWGVLRPVVVFPASLLLGLAPAQAEAVMLHELAHVRRHDYLVNLLQSVVETALFYHPAVWWVSSVVRREREHVCDDLVVDALGDPAPYARALLLLEERRRAPRPALSAKEGKLMDRIARILAPRPAPVRLSPLAPALAALAVVGLALGGVLRAEAQATPPLASKKSAATTPSVASARKMVPEEIAQNRMLIAQRILLMRKLAISQAGKGRADAALQKAMNAQIQALEAQVDAARAQERALQGTVRPNGATYGAPGKGQHPVWTAQSYPQGVGRLADPTAQDAWAFDEAQASLMAGSSARRPAARKDVPSARKQVLDLYWKAQRDSAAVAAQATVNRAQADLARVQAIAEAERKVGADADPAAAAQIRADIARAEEVLAQASAARDARAPLPGKASSLWNDRPRLDLRPGQNGASTIPQAAPLRLSGESEASVEYDPGHRLVSLDANRSPFAATLRALAKKARLSIVIDMGAYYDVTVVLDETPVAQALEVLCKAGHATFRREGGVYYIASMVSAPSGGGGGFVGGRGG